METHSAERIILVGPTGSGKTTAGERAAALLGWTFLDTDTLVEQAAGRSVPEVFAQEGEPRFRDLEAAALCEATARQRVVIATGAGMLEREANLSLARACGWMVALVARPEIAYERLRGASEGEPLGARRPMLAGDDPLRRMQALVERRAAGYAAADETIVTDDLDADEVARRIVAGLAARGLLAGDGPEEWVRHIRTATGDGYDAVVGWGALATLGARLRTLGLPPRLHVVADDAVARLYEPALMSHLLAEGFEPLVYRVPSGEASKSRAQLEAVHDWLTERRAERGEALVTLGGGVVGDLAGFAAATYLRGLPLVQVPTSLLAQVDASVGGKVAIDHPRGKNLIGAFYPPRLVVADPATLLTMPTRQRIEGWAEVLKHGIALDAAYFERVERDAEALFALRPAETTAAIAGSVAIKASLVERDEYEREGGARHLLNYGHTIAHAIEAVTGYGAWLHGEAVAVGMMVAARLGERLNITPSALVERQEMALARFGLPVQASGLSASALLRAAMWDKKVRRGQVRWVLPTAIGTSALYDEVPEDDVRAALVVTGAVDDLVAAEAAGPGAQATGRGTATDERHA
jgi:shikimate kinase / 3-dehydroquinate synthase